LGLLERQADGHAVARYVQLISRSPAGRSPEVAEMSLACAAQHLRASGELVEERPQALEIAPGLAEFAPSRVGQNQARLHSAAKAALAREVSQSWREHWVQPEKGTGACS